MDWKELWLANYRGEGDTADIKAKTLDFGDSKSKRNGVSYLAWAVAERIFKLQGGTYEILKTKYPKHFSNGENIVETFNESIVELDTLHVGDVVDNNGVATPRIVKSYFVNVKVDWQGLTHIERYPLQNNNGDALTIWTQNDINKNIQRAKVKAIALISGIGYKLYEDGDLQFETDEEKAKKEDGIKKETTAKADALKEEIKKETAGTNKKPTTKKEVATEPEKAKEPENRTEVSEKVVTKEEVEKVIGTVTAEEIKQPEIKVPDRITCETAIKDVFLSGNSNKTNVIRSFLREIGKTKIAELSNEQIEKLYIAIQ